MEIIKELNLNGNPQTVKNGSITFAKNIRLSADGTYITNDEGMVVSMVYMEHRGKEPPHELIVNPVFKDNKGRTQAMHFLINCFGTLPEIFMHDIYIADNNGNTLEYYSVVYNHRYDPRFEISNLYKNAFGDTLVMALIENFGEDIMTLKL